MKTNPLSSTTKPCPALRLISTKKLSRENWLVVGKQGSDSPDAASIKGHAKHRKPIPAH